MSKHTGRFHPMAAKNKEQETLTVHVVIKPPYPNLLIALGTNTCNSSFCSMKELGVLLLPLDGVLAHSRLLPNILSSCPNNSLVPVLLSGESKESCPRTQHNDPSQGSNLDQLIWSPVHKPLGYCTSHNSTVRKIH